MRTLALETTERIGSLALLEDGRLVSEVMLTSEGRSAATLAPGIQKLLAQAAWQAEEVDLVAVANGPGSFTGLRVGVTTAKTFAYATGGEILGIDTLEVIAAQADIAVPSLWSIMDAHRDQLFAAQFSLVESERQTLQPTQIVDRQAWLEGLVPGDWVTGPITGRLREELPSQVDVLDEALWAPKAATVARLAERAYAEGKRDDLWQLVPDYYRKSAAEEQAEAADRR